MNGVTITRKVISPTSSTRVRDALAIVLLVPIGLIVLPFFGLLMLGLWLRNHLFSTRTGLSEETAEWYTVDTRSDLTLRYQYIRAAAISAEAEGYFEHEPLVRYQANPDLTFFDGYFTDFRVARVDGLFVQKIQFDAGLTEVIAMPLYFFSYQTQEAEALLNLQDYELETKGKPDDFILEAINEHEALHIRLVRK